MVVGGFVGANVGYWIGHLAGWSKNAEWPFQIGGGDGAIGLSIGMSILGVFLSGLALALLDAPTHKEEKRCSGKQFAPRLSKAATQ
jgi:hypothetical protein